MRGAYRHRRKVHEVNSCTIKILKRQVRWMSDLKKKINYTVVCVNELSNKFHITAREAFHYLYDYRGIAFIKEHYDIEHTLSLDDAVEDLVLICRNNGGNL